MAAESKATVLDHKELAQSKLFDNVEFASRYKIGEVLTGLFGLDMLHQMNLQSGTAPVSFLDLACGTGVVTKQAVQILSSKRPLSEDRFTCADLAPAMLDVLRQRLGIEEWAVDASQVEVLQANMKDTKLPSDTYDYLGCNFGPCIAPDPLKTFKESYRMLKPGGVGGWTAWQNVGWLPDMARCIDDIRAAAVQRLSDGINSESDQQLSKLPSLPPFDVFGAHFAGIDMERLRADGVSDDDIPRWDKEEFVKSQVELAGFSDVKTTTEVRSFSISETDAEQMIMPIVGIMSTLWKEDEKKALAGAPLQEKVKEWWQKRFQEDDVEDGKIVWNDFRATVVTGRKAL